MRRRLCIALLSTAYLFSGGATRAAGPQNQSAPVADFQPLIIPMPDIWRMPQSETFYRPPPDWQRFGFALSQTNLYQPGTPLTYRVTLPPVMNYADEAAYTLGVRNGRMDVFSTKPRDNSFVPSFIGGIKSDRAMFQLKWRTGR